MPVKINIGLSRKIGQPDFGSIGATCNVEFEIDGGYDNGSTERFQDAVSRAYTACREAVDAELSAHQPGLTSKLGGLHQPPRTERTTSQPNDGSQVKKATASQTRAIYAIANSNGISLAGVLAEWNVERPDDLSIRDASKVIDQLKNPIGSVAGQ